MEDYLVKKKKIKRKQPKGLSKSNVVGYAGVEVHGKGVYTDLKYTVLTCTLVSEIDRTKIESVLKTIVTGPQAANLPDGVNGWSCLKLDGAHGLGRAFLVSYKGIECALFFKRQLTEIKLQEGDRHPEGVLKDPDNAWQRLDLLGKSAKESNVILFNERTRLKDSVERLESLVKTYKDLNDRYRNRRGTSSRGLTWFTPAEKKKAERRKRQDNKVQAKLLIKKHEKIAKELAAKKKREKEKEMSELTPRQLAAKIIDDVVSDHLIVEDYLRNGIR